MMGKRQTLIRSAKRFRNFLRDFPSTPQSIVYDGYKVRFPEILFHFQVGRKTYINRLVLENFRESDLAQLDPARLDVILSHIGLAFVPFMYGLEDFESVLVKAMPISEAGRSFFQDFFLKGLGELRYVQGLDVSKPISVSSSDSRPPWEGAAINPDAKALLLNGGGKDSAVAAEILKKMGLPFVWFTVDLNPVREKVIAASGQKEAYSVRVEMDPAVRKDTKYHWGTPPYVALFNFISLVPAYIHRCRYVVVGNEYSANFGNLVHNGIEINHQYSKSFEFESSFDRYAKASILKDVHHFSLLRPFYELRLAQMFANCPQYFDAFISCNEGLHKGFWCKECPKCAFVCLVLSPFLTGPQLKLIFGEDLLQRKVIRAHILDLVNASTKPWECVGTKEECRLALVLILMRHPGLDFGEWPRRSNLEEYCRDVDVEASKQEYLRSWKTPHNIPQELAGPVQTAAESLSVN